MSTSTKRDLRALLNPASIAVVGASPKGNRGLTVLQNLRRFGTSARLYAVHPRLTEVDGVPAFPTLSDLPEVPEFVAITVGADNVPPILEEAGRLGAKAGLIIASGFGEGGVGQDRRNQVVDSARRYGMELCGPNCYGVLNALDGFAAYSGDVVAPFETGSIAMVMQSGALTHSFTDSAVGRGLGLSHLITTGNELVTGLGEYVSALADDDRVRAIGVFIEGLRDPEAFAQAARRAHRAGKPVVALTVGRSEQGQAAAMAHTGAIAGNDQAMAGFLRSAGVIRVDDLDELRETLIAFTHGRRPAGEGAAFVSISGGGAGLLSDLSEAVGLSLPQPTGAAAEAISNRLPDFGTAANPLDATGAAVEDPEILPAVSAELAGVEGVGAVALALNVPGGSLGQEWLYRKQAQQWAELAETSPVPLVAITLVSGTVDAEVHDTLRNAGIPLLVGPRAGLAALQSWLAWHASEPRPVPEPLEFDVPAQTLRAQIGQAPVLSGKPALDLVSAAGIPTPTSKLVTSADEAAKAVADLGGTVAVKVESAQLAHKTEVGGVVLGVETPEEAADAVRRIQAQVQATAPQTPIDGYLVQSQVAKPQVECLLGAIRDPQVGMVVSVAPGGVLVELGGPVPSRPAPLSKDDVDELLDATPLGRLLGGYRGSPPADREALVDLVIRFSHLVHQLGEDVGAVEINPVLVNRAGHGAIAVDALFIQESQS